MRKWNTKCRTKNKATVVVDISNTPSRNARRILRKSNFTNQQLALLQKGFIEIPRFSGTGQKITHSFNESEVSVAANLPLKMPL